VEIKYRKEIESMFNELFREDGMSDSEYNELMDTAAQCGVTVENISKDIEDGIDSGYTLEYVLNLFKKYMINAIKTYKVITGWIHTSDKEIPLDVLTVFITDTFSRRFPVEDNQLHRQMVSDMLENIEGRRAEIGECENLGIVHQMDLP